MVIVGNASVVLFCLIGYLAVRRRYVRMKHRACVEVGMNAIDVNLPESVDQETLINKVKELNQDPTVHGILVSWLCDGKGSTTSLNTSVGA